MKKYHEGTELVEKISCFDELVDNGCFKTAPQSIISWQYLDRAPTSFEEGRGARGSCLSRMILRMGRLGGLRRNTC
jgi:hypothetical protein